MAQPLNPKTAIRVEQDFDYIRRFKMRADFSAEFSAQFFSNPAILFRLKAVTSFVRHFDPLRPLYRLAFAGVMRHGQ
jgi:hypothetical protein